MSLAKDDSVESLGIAGAAASRAASTTMALKAEPLQTSWWPRLSLWSTPMPPATSATLTDLPRSEAQQKKEGHHQAHEAGIAQLKRD